MKKVFSVLCAILIASSMVVSAFAADGPSPNVEAPKPTQIVIKDSEGNVISTNEGDDLDSNIQLTVNDEKAEIAPEVKESIEKAEAALNKLSSLAEIDPAFEGKEALPVMNVSFSDEITTALENGASVAIEIDMKMENVEAGTRIPIIRFIDNQWVVSEDEYAEVLEDGTVVLHLNQPGEFTLVVDPVKEAE